MGSLHLRPTSSRAGGVTGGSRACTVPGCRTGDLGMKPASGIDSVAIIGNGLMGQGISQVFARKGKRVTLIGRNAASLERALGAIRGNFEAFVARGLTS